MFLKILSYYNQMNKYLDYSIGMILLIIYLIFMIFLFKHCRKYLFTQSYKVPYYCKRFI